MYSCHGKNIKIHVIINIKKYIIISFILKLPESKTINNQIGSTINAGNHLVNIAAPILTPARMLYINFFFCENKILKNMENSIKNKKKISIWSLPLLPAVN